MKNSQFIALLVCVTFCFCLLSFSIIYASNEISMAIYSTGTDIYNGLMLIHNALP